MFSEKLLYRDKNANQGARNDKHLLLGVKEEQLEKILDAHYHQIEVPLKEGLQKTLRTSSSRIDSSDKLKEALENELDANVQGGKTLKERGVEFSKNWNEELKARNTALYQIQTARSAWGALKKVDGKGFKKLSDVQKIELRDTLEKLNQTVQGLILDKAAQ